MIYVPRVICADNFPPSGAPEVTQASSSARLPSIHESLQFPFTPAPVALTPLIYLRLSPARAAERPPTVMKRPTTTVHPAAPMPRTPSLCAAKSRQRYARPLK